MHVISGRMRGRIHVIALLVMVFLQAPSVQAKCSWQIRFGKTLAAGLRFFRYPVTTETLEISSHGSEKITPGFGPILAKGNKRILFLISHPTWGVDPLLSYEELYDDFFPRPVIFQDEIDAHAIILKELDPIGMPNPLKMARQEFRAQTRRKLDETADSLEAGKNIAEWPAAAVGGRIGRRSGLFKLIERLRERKMQDQVRVVIVRMEGLEGSMFSPSGRRRPPESTGRLFAWGAGVVAGNLGLFTPKRDVTMRFIEVTGRFPWQGNRDEVNGFVDNLFEDPPPVPRRDIPLFFFQRWGRQVSTNEVFSLEEPDSQPEALPLE